MTQNVKQKSLPTKLLAQKANKAKVVNDLKEELNRYSTVKAYLVEYIKQCIEDKRDLLEEVNGDGYFRTQGAVKQLRAIIKDLDLKL